MPNYTVHRKLTHARLPQISQIFCSFHLLQSDMGGFHSFFIESRFFQLLIEEGGCYFSLQIFERGKYFMRSVFMGKSAAQWLMKNIEHIVLGVSSKQFFTFRDSDIAYTLQWSTKSFGQFLLLTKLKVWRV